MPFIDKETSNCKMCCVLVGVLGMSKKALDFCLLFIVAIASVFFFMRIWEPYLTGDSINYAVISKNIVLTNDWLNLRLNGHFYFNKPPLLFWLIALSFKLFGISAFAARLPVAIFGVFDAVLIYYLGKIVFNQDRELAAVSSIFYVVNFHVLRLNTIVRFEAVLLFFILTSVIFLLQKRYIIAFIFIALGFLTKGPLVFFGVLSYVIWKIVRKEWDFICLDFFMGMVIFVILAGPWFVYQAVKHPSFVDKYVVNQIIDRITGTLNEGTPRNYLFYFEKLLRRYWPGLPFFVYGLYLFFKDKLYKSDLWLFVFIYVVTVFLIINVPKEKFTRYLYYIYPFASYFCALAIDKLNAKRITIYLTVVLTVLYLGLGIFYKGTFHHPFGKSEYRIYASACEIIKKYKNAQLVGLSELEKSYFNFYCLQPNATKQAVLIKRNGSFEIKPLSP